MRASLRIDEDSVNPFWTSVPIARVDGADMGAAAASSEATSSGGGAARSISGDAGGDEASWLLYGPAQNSTTLP